MCGFSLFEGQGDKGSVVAPPNDRHQPVGTGGGPPPTLPLSLCLFSCGDRPAPPKPESPGRAGGLSCPDWGGVGGLVSSLVWPGFSIVTVLYIQYSTGRLRGASGLRRVAKGPPGQWNGAL